MINHGVFGLGVSATRIPRLMDDGDWQNGWGPGAGFALFEFKPEGLPAPSFSPRRQT